MGKATGTKATAANGSKAKRSESVILVKAKETPGTYQFKAVNEKGEQIRMKDGGIPTDTLYLDKNWGERIKVTVEEV